MKKRKPPRMFYPKAIELRYKIRLRRLMQNWIARTLSALEKRLPHVIADADQEHRQDAWPDSVKEIMDQLKISFDNDIKQNEVYALDIGQRTSKWNNNQWRKTMKSVMGIEDVFRRDKFQASRMKSFVDMNTELITKLSQETLVNVRRIVEGGIKSGDRYEDIRDNLLEDGFTDSESRAELIARDQVGKLNGELTEARQKNLGFEKYIWRTAGDERVRDSHMALSGLMCRWDDDSVYSDDEGKTWKSRDSIGGHVGTPGSDFQCRCYAEAVFEDDDEEEQ